MTSPFFVRLATPLKLFLFRTPSIASFWSAVIAAAVVCSVSDGLTFEHAAVEQIIITEEIIAISFFI